ncbi:MAG: hypothetical protein JNK05_17840 [Myxococcales bacterium]|nr:hypothetical protein [Myxococcales bacterium]
MKPDTKARSKILRHKPAPRAPRDARANVAPPVAPPRRFMLAGARSLTHRRTRAMLDARGGGAIAWGRPESGALVVVRAEDFGALVGREPHPTTFAPSRFCGSCGEFVGPQPARCVRCNPRECAAVKVR